jgi:hypothetical protein
VAAPGASFTVNNGAAAVGQSEITELAQFVHDHVRSWLQLELRNQAAAIVE